MQQKDSSPDGETREVRVDDPSLSEDANRVLTDELRKAVGAKQVRVPPETPRREHDVRGDGGGLGRLLGRNRLLLGITLIAALVVGAILALAVEKWWTLFIPMGVHALGTLIVGFLVVQMTTQSEAPDPRVTAALEAEGVPAPERAFNNLVEEFSGATDARGATEVVTTDDNENTQDPDADPGGAATQQRTAMTPAQGESAPSGGGSAVMAVEWFVILGLIAASVVVAIGEGALGWLLPAVTLPVCAGWIAYQRIARRGRDKGGTPPAGDSAHQRRRAVLITVGCVLAIEALTVVVVILGRSSS